MKIILYFIFLFINVTAFGQSVNQKFDDLKFFTAPTKSSEVDEPLYQKITFDSVIQASKGVFITVEIKREQVFWENGILRYQRFYKKNKPFGKWQYFAQTGILKYTLQNYPEYFIIKLHYPNQNIRSLRRYKTHIKATMGGCTEEDYYPNGSMQANGSKKPIQKTNSWTLVENGKWHYFFPSGGLESEGKFKKGVKNGKWINYDQNGKRTRISKFSNGELVTQKKL